MSDYGELRRLAEAWRGTGSWWAFVAAANPDVVLSLLDDLEKARASAAFWENRYGHESRLRCDTRRRVDEARAAVRYVLAAVRYHRDRTLAGWDAAEGSDYHQDLAERLWGEVLDQ